MQIDRAKASKTRNPTISWRILRPFETDWEDAELNDARANRNEVAAEIIAESAEHNPHWNHESFVIQIKGAGMDGDYRVYLKWQPSCAAVQL